MFIMTTVLSRLLRYVQESPELRATIMTIWSALLKLLILLLETADGRRKFAPPSYFERLFEKDFPEEAQHRKAMKQAVAIEKRKLQLSKTDLSEEDYLKLEEESLTNRLSPLYNYRSL